MGKITCSKCGALAKLYVDMRVESISYLTVEVLQRKVSAVDEWPPEHDVTLYYIDSDEVVLHCPQCDVKVDVPISDDVREREYYSFNDDELIDRVLAEVRQHLEEHPESGFRMEP